MMQRQCLKLNAAFAAPVCMMRTRRSQMLQSKCIWFNQLIINVFEYLYKCWIYDSLFFLRIQVCVNTCQKGKTSAMILKRQSLSFIGLKWVMAPPWHQFISISKQSAEFTRENYNQIGKFVRNPRAISQILQAWVSVLIVKVHDI